MKQSFIPKSFGKLKSKLLKICDEIISDYLKDGFTLTTRQLYYQLVARDLIENTVPSYNRIKSLISGARLAGLLDWDAIEDRGRVVRRISTWDTPQQIIRSACYSFRIDHWDFQPVAVLVMVEKQALEGVLTRVCNEWGVKFVANKGYASSTLLYQQGQWIRGLIKTKRKIHVLYLGDHDPSGLDMDRDIQERLAMFSGSGHEDMIVTRLALTRRQIAQYNPPPNPAKLSDARATGYIAAHGQHSWELDALTPNLLVTLVGDEIKRIVAQHGMQDNWEESTALQLRMERELKEMSSPDSEERWKKERQDLSYKLWEQLDEGCEEDEDI